jgi:hypothetical protein
VDSDDSACSIIALPLEELDIGILERELDALKKQKKELLTDQVRVKLPVGGA